jgi:hypothetical protein
MNIGRSEKSASSTLYDRLGRLTVGESGMRHD